MAVMTVGAGLDGSVADRGWRCCWGGRWVDGCELSFCRPEGFDWGCQLWTEMTAKLDGTDDSLGGMAVLLVGGGGVAGGR